MSWRGSRQAVRQLYGMARRLRCDAFAVDLADVLDVDLAAAASWRFALDDCGDNAASQRP